MRKIIGIGETIFDIIFENGRPSAATPGGSVFNGLISLARMGLNKNICFISETGNDKVGQTILNFMKENGLSTEHVNVFPDGKSPVSLAFLNQESDAEYVFYKDYPSQRLDVKMPEIHEDDIVVIGSYYALNPLLRDKILELLEAARAHHAIVYYDPNFRSTHQAEALKLAPTIIENLEYASIVRGAADDFFYMYNLRDADKIYQDKIKFYTPNFICTAGNGQIALRTRQITRNYQAKSIQPVSTVGAGDSFNAGILYGLLKYDIHYHEIDCLPEDTWNKIIQCGIDFSAQVCMSLENYVSKDFASKYLSQGNCNR